jgi:hypothetical protein
MSMMLAERRHRVHDLGPCGVTVELPSRLWNDSCIWWPEALRALAREGSLILIGCGGALLATIAIALLVYAISGGQCTMIVFP